MITMQLLNIMLLLLNIIVVFVHYFIKTLTLL